MLLQPRAALALGMAVHELTTNAVKHGALSVPEGIVQIAWHLERSAVNELLVLNSERVRMDRRCRHLLVEALG